MQLDSSDRCATGVHEDADKLFNWKSLHVRPATGQVSLGVSSSDLFDGGIKVGMGGPGRVPQWKRKPGTVALRKDPLRVQKTKEVRALA